MHNPNHDSNILVNILSNNIKNKYKKPRRAIQNIYNKKSVKIMHSTPFEVGGSYTLYISKDIIGMDGSVNLNTSVKMAFTVSN